MSYIAHLLVLRQVHKHGDKVRLEEVDLDHFGELAELPGSGAPYHRSVVLAQVAELAAKVGCKKCQ